MKKSQIMAVFALALALGAVAPIAGVVSSASAFRAKDTVNNIGGEMSCTEAGYVITAVNGYSDNIRVKAYTTAVKAYTDELKDKTNITAAIAKTRTNSLNTFVGNVNAIRKTGWSVIGLADYVTEANSAAGITQANFGQAINLVNTNAVTIRLRAMVKNLDENPSLGITNFVDEFGYDTKGLPSGGTDIRTLGTDAAKVAAIKGDTAYATVKTFLNTLDGYAENYDTYTYHLGKVRQAAEALYPNQLTAAGKTALEGQYKNNIIADGIKDYADLSGTLVLFNGAQIDFYNDWTVTIKGDIDAIDTLCSSVHPDEGDVYDLVEKLVIDYAVAAKDSRRTTEAGIITITRELMGRGNTTPSTDPGTTDTPAGEDNTDADVNAPNTGILSSAEGSATTISIVAGLTTALASLGAGVVAYRSARRGE